MYSLEPSHAETVMFYIVASIIATIVASSATALFLLSAQVRDAGNLQPAPNESLSMPHRRPNPLLESIAPPAPRTRTSIDLLRRRHFGGDISPPLPAAAVPHGGCGTASPSYQTTHPLDSLELDSDTVSCLDCCGLNRILSSVRPEEVETQRLVLDSFNWDLDVLLETELMTGAGTAR